MLRDDTANELTRRSELRDRLQTLARTVSGNDKLRLSIRGQMGGSTDGKNIVAIGDPVALEKVGFSEEDSLASSVVTTVHEGAHIMAGSDQALLNKVMQKLTKKGADEKLVYLALDAAEDLRVDAVMSKERPGYGEMKDQAAKAFVDKIYKPSGDPKTDAMIIAVAKLFAGADLTGHNWRHVDPKTVDALVRTLGAAAQAKSCEEAMRIGYKAYRRAYGFEDKPKGGSSGGEGSDSESEDKEKSPGSGENAGKGPKEEKEGAKDEERSDEDGVGGADDADDPADADRDPTEGDEGPASDDGDGADRDDEPDPGADAGGGDDADPESSGTGSGGDGSGEGDAEGDADDTDGEFDTALGEAKADRSGGGLGGGSGEHILNKLVDDRTRDKLKKASGDTGVHGMSIEQAWREVEENKAATRKLGYYEQTPELIAADVKVAKGIHIGYSSWYLTEKYMTELDGYDRKQKASGKDPAIKSMRSGLTRALADELRKSKEADTYLHKSGVKVHASKVWRATKLSRPEVMIKKEEKSTGGWHVDIWVDASGSQSGSVDSIRKMLYALVGSFRDVGIDCRVFSWQYEGEHLTINRVIQGPSDPLEQVNRYYAGGDNRDGHAARVATELLSNVNADHKLLVWISDGLPSHNARPALATLGALNFYGSSRDGGQGVYDTATAIREARKRFKVLGILIDRGQTFNEPIVDYATGAVEGDRDVSQADTAALIYGRDFVNVNTKAGDEAAILNRIPGAIKNYLARLLRG